MKYQKWLDKNIKSLKGKTIIVTGANSGLGYNCTKALVYKNAQVIMACRNKKRALDAKNKIINEFPNAKIEIEILDLSSFESIKSFVQRINDRKIDALINNAGVYYLPKASKTKDGLDMTIGTNYFGMYYLISLLEEKLELQENSKIINVTSITYRFSKLDLDDLNCEKVKNRNSLYAKSKLAIAAYTYAKQKETDTNKSNLHYYLIHPGISATNIIASKDGGFSKWFSKVGTIFMKIFFHSPEKACLSMLLPFSNNGYYENYGPRVFQISGYPKKIKNTKKQIILSNYIILKTEDYLKSMFLK